MHTHTYTHTHREREGEGERERDSDIGTLLTMLTSHLCVHKTPLDLITPSPNDTHACRTKDRSREGAIHS